MALRSFLFFTFFSFPIFAQQIGDFVYSPNIPLENHFTTSLGYTLYLIHVQIADHSVSQSVPLIQYENLSLIDSIKSLSSYRLINSMSHSSDRVRTLDEYLSSLKSIFYITNATQRQLKFEISSLSSEIASCSKQKKNYDKQYLKALEDSPSVQDLESLILLSQNSASCISNREILLISKQHLSDRISNEISPLADKYDYLIQNRETIIDHFDLLDSDYLQKIIDVQKTLKEY